MPSASSPSVIRAFGNENETPMTAKLESLINEIHRQCVNLGSQDHLTWELKQSLLGLSRPELRLVVSSVANGCPPLFKACRVGNLEVAKFLIEECRADVDQTGVTVEGNQKCSEATPLWCAAVKGYKKLVAYLLSAGANINAVTDTGSTAVRSACFVSQLDVVAYLVEHGADIERPNRNGGTCLINSVQSPELCLYLVNHGANVNAQDVLGKTALHYAIEEKYWESIDILIRAGADLALRTIEGDTCLRLACRLGFEDLARRLMNFQPELLVKDRVDCLLLLGSSLYERELHFTALMRLWTEAQDMRSDVEERAVYGTAAAAACNKRMRISCGNEEDPAGDENFLTSFKKFKDAKEFRTKRELMGILEDVNATRIQSLLVYKRILGWAHDDTMRAWFYRASAFQEGGEKGFAFCIFVEMLANELKLNGPFGSLGTNILNGPIRQILGKAAPGAPDVDIPDWLEQDDVLEILELLIPSISEYRPLLEIRPQNFEQIQIFDSIICCIPHLLHVAASFDEKNPKLIAICGQLWRMRCGTYSKGSSLLHLASSCLNTDDRVLARDQLPEIYPSARVVSLLLNSGWDPNLADEKNHTALDVVCPYLKANLDGRRLAVVRLLLERGCHPDRTDDLGNSSYNRLPVFIKPVLSLQCLAAQTLCKRGSSAEDEHIRVLSVQMVEFLALHAAGHQRLALGALLKNGERCISCGNSICET